MGVLVRLSSKGQLVIPKSVRQELGLEPGDQFHLSCIVCLVASWIR